MGSPEEKPPRPAGLILGAGDAGESLLREIVHRPQLGYSVMGFIDDNPAKIGSVINDVQVIGNLNDLERLAIRYEIDEVLIAIPSAAGDVMRRIIKACEGAGIGYKTLPSLGGLIEGRARLGVTPIHRRSFGPVRKILEKTS